MRNLKSIIAIIAISLATTFSTSATEKEPLKETNKLRKEIVTMLGNKIPIQFEKAENVEVAFMINKKNEIVIVSIDSKISEFNTYVKRKLNYKKVKATGTEKEKVYKIPVRVTIK